MIPAKLDKEKVEKALFRLYDEQRELQQHPSFPWIDEIPGYKFVCDSIDHFEEILDEIEADEWASSCSL